MAAAKKKPAKGPAIDSPPVVVGNSRLAEALAALDAGQTENGLEHALQAWRTTRSPAIAVIVDRISERLQRARPETPPGKQEADRREIWFKLEAKRLASDVEELLRTFLDLRNLRDLKPRVEALMKRPEDPRIGLFAASMLETRYARGTPVWKLWRLLPALALIHADPRAWAVLDRVGQEQRGGRPFVNAGLNRANVFGKTAFQIRELLDKKRWPQEPVGADAEVLLKLAGTFAADAKAEVSDGKTEAEFLARIREAPADDGLRQVFADWLLEHGNPRGEFINLQLQRAGSGRAPGTAAVRRENALLRLHELEWLGALAPVVLKDGLEFERGFLHACRGNVKTDRIGNQVVGVEEWATVADLDVTGWRSGSWLKAVHHPVMRSLKRLRGVSGGMLFQEGGDLAIETLGFGGEDRWEYDLTPTLTQLIAHQGRFPLLREVLLGSSTITPAPVFALWKSDLGRRLVSFEVTLRHTPRQPMLHTPWILAMSALPPNLLRYTIDKSRSDWRLVFERESAGAPFSKLQAKYVSMNASRIPETALAELGAVLAPIGTGMLRELTVTATKQVGSRIDVAAFGERMKRQNLLAKFEFDLPFQKAE